MVSWEDGEEEAFREGVAMSMGDVVAIVIRVRWTYGGAKWYLNVWIDNEWEIYEDGSEERLQ